MNKGYGKRMLALLLALAMTLGFGSVTLAAVADNSQQIGNYYKASQTNGALEATPSLAAGGTKLYFDKNGTATTVDKAVVTLDKTIAATGTENEFDVTVEVTTTQSLEEVSQSADAAVVLVLDVSGSMSGDKLAGAKKAAQSFLNGFAPAAGDSAKRKVAIVAFSSNAKTVQGWTDAANLKTQSDATYCDPIRNLSANGGTNIEGGLMLAENLLGTCDGSIPATGRYVILMSDGKPTYYVMDTDWKVQEIPSENMATQLQSYNNDGHGGHGRPGGRGVTLVASTNRASTSFIWGRRGGGDKTNHTDHTGAEEVAGSITGAAAGSTKKANLFSVYFGGRNDEIECEDGGDSCSLHDEKKIGGDNGWLKVDLNSDRVFTSSNSNELLEDFQKMLEWIKLDAKAWILTDPMGEAISYQEQIYAGSNNPNSVTAPTGAGNTITWNLKNSTGVKTTVSGVDTYTYTLTYRIKLDNTQADFDTAKWYPTNGATSLTYYIEPATGADDLTPEQIQALLKTVYANVPSVKGYLADLTFNKVDDRGNAVNGAVFTLNGKNATSAEGKVAFTNIPSGAVYTLTETALEGYTGLDAAYRVVVSYGTATLEKEVKDEQAGTTAWVPVADKKVVNIAEEQKPGVITVQKVLDGDIASASDLPDGMVFTFTITGDNVEKTLTISKAELLSGTDSKESGELAPGDYTVSEAKASIDGYELETTVAHAGQSKAGRSVEVTLAEEGAETVVFTNSYTKLPSYQVIHHYTVIVDGERQDAGAYTDGVHIGDFGDTIALNVSTPSDLPASPSDLPATPSDLRLEHNGEVYEFVEVVPPSASVTLEEGKLYTIDLYYERVVRNPATYTVVHEYYSNTDNAGWVKDGFTSSVLTGNVNDVVDPDAIAQVNTYTNAGGVTNTYDYKKTTYEGSLQLATPSDLVITLRYEREVTTEVSYTVVHQYYTVTDGNKEKDGENSYPFTGNANDVISLDDISRELNYGGIAYEFQTIAVTQGSLTLTPGADPLVITLTYQREVKTPISYTIVHKYYTSENDGPYELDGSTSGEYTGEKYSYVDVSAIQRVNHYQGNTYAFYRMTPDTDQQLLENGTVVITLEYRRDTEKGGHGPHFRDDEEIPLSPPEEPQQEIPLAPPITGETEKPAWIGFAMLALLGAGMLVKKRILSR